MEAPTDLKVTAADRMDGCVILTFNDGRCGIYSPQLLHAMLPSAQELWEPKGEEPDMDTATT